MQSLTIKPDGVEGELTRVLLAGEITEASDLRPLQDVPGQGVLLDLAQVERINSFGVREWITFLRTLRTNEKRVVLARCSVPLVQQINLVSNFRGHAEVRSIMAPYICTDCNVETTHCFEVAGLTAEQLDAGIPCSSCGKQAEFDDVPSAYLSFLKR